MVHILQGKQSSGSIGQSHSVTNSAVLHVSRLKRKKKKEVWVTGLTTCMFGLEGVRLSLVGQLGKPALANGLDIDGCRVCSAWHVGPWFVL